MLVAKWRYLTEGVRDRARAVGLINGCGGKGSWVPVPDFMFKASCDHHDFNYWVGNTERLRKRADDQFYSAMLLDADRQEGLVRRWWCRRLAWVYYLAVRWFGKPYFHYGPRERTMADLETILMGETREM